MRYVAIVGAGLLGGCNALLGIHAFDAVDAPLEAYSSFTMAAAHSWRLESTTGGYSGAGYMQLLPDNAVTCGMPVSQCASLVYAVTDVEAGTYYFHARLLGRTASDNSVHYGVDNATQATPLMVVGTGTFQWVTGEKVTLTAGSHTLHVWHREAGIHVDRLALTMSPIPPP